MKTKYLLVAILVVCACNVREKREMTNAEITERQMLSNGKLLITYTYTFKQLQFIGREEVENRPIGSNNLRVTFPIKNPLKCSVVLP